MKRLQTEYFKFHNSLFLVIFTFLLLTSCNSRSDSVDEYNAEIGPTNAKEFLRHRNDIDISIPNINILRGLVNDDNRIIRDKLYAKLSWNCSEKMYQKNVVSPNTHSEIDIIVEGHKNILDYSLGIDFPEYKRIKFRKFHRDFLNAKEQIDSTYEVDRNEHSRLLSKRYAIFLQQVAHILSDKEFFALYEHKKENFNHALDRFFIEKH